MTSLKDKLQNIYKVAESLSDKTAFVPKGKYTGSNAPSAGAVNPGGTSPSSGTGKFTKNFGGSPTTGPGTSPGTGFNGGAGLPEVKEMQKAIQIFADKAVGYTPDPAKKGAVSPTDKRKDFNDFLAEQYSAKSDVKGEEYTPDPTKTKKEEKQPTELVEMDNAIDGLRRIGPGKDEMTPDGSWGFRTNNAVNNTYAFANALVKVVDDFGSVPPNAPWVFKKNDLKNMKDNLISGDIKDPIKEKVPSDDLKRKALALAPLIKKLTAFYDQYSKIILEHPAYTSYIKKDYPLFKVSPGGTDPGKLKPEDSELLGKNPNLDIKMQLPGKKGVVPIKGLATGYLKDMESFRNLMFNVLGYSPEETSDPNLQKKVLNALMQHVNDSLSTMVSSPVAPPVAKTV